LDQESNQVYSGGDKHLSNGDGEDDEHEEPPKAEEIKQVEEGAVFSAKCSVHTLVNGTYEKKGVGYISLKDSANKKQLIIRAATTIGSIWSNTFVNDDFKWNKLDEKKTHDNISFDLWSRHEI